MRAGTGAATAARLPRRPAIGGRSPGVANASLEALKSANSPDARSVVLELDETDTVDGIKLPGADLSGEELIIQVIPQAADEFTCYSCFLVRHHSQLAREKNGRAYCIECEG